MGLGLNSTGQPASFGSVCGVLLGKCSGPEHWLLLLSGGREGRGSRGGRGGRGAGPARGDGGAALWAPILPACQASSPARALLPAAIEVDILMQLGPV